MIKSYKLICHKGYLGDFVTEWWTDKDWEKYKKYVDECIADGTYGEEFEVNLQLETCTEFDAPIKSSTPVESYKVVILDFNK